MPNFLVIANVTLTGSRLRQALLERAGEHPGARFHLVLPSAPVEDGHDLSHSEHLRFEGEARKVTAERRRLKSVMDRLAGEGLHVTGEVVDVSPLKAAKSALDNGEFDEVIVSTLPSGPSVWLKLDLPSRLRRQTDVPVTHVEASSAPTT